MTSVSEICAELKIDPKRGRRILRKVEDLKHEHGAAWELDAKLAARVRKILIEATGAEPAPAPKAEKKVAAKKAPKKEKAAAKQPQPEAVPA